MSTDSPEECTDYQGRSVKILASRIRHVVARHPEVLPYMDRLCDVLQTPDVVLVQSRSNEDSYLYCKLGVTSGRLARTYIVVVTSFSPEREGLVKTVYASSRLPRGRMIHMRRQL